MRARSWVGRIAVLALVASVVAALPARASTAAGTVTSTNVVSSVYATAQALDATAAGQTIATTTVQLPSDGGGPFHSTVFDQQLLGVMSAHALSASTRGTGTPYPSVTGAATAKASTTGLSILGVISATAVSGQCRVDRTGAKANSALVAAVIGGQAETASPSPNTMITIPLVAQVILDEVAIQNVDGPGRNPQATVTALHVIGLGALTGVDIAVGHAVCRAQVVPPPNKPGVPTVFQSVGEKHTATTPPGTSLPATGESEDRNEGVGWVVPDGPNVGTPGPKVAATGTSVIPPVSAGNIASVSFAAPSHDPTVNFEVNTANVPPTGAGLWPPDPTGANSGRELGDNTKVALVSTNYGLARSTDDGATFTQLDISNLFPNTPGVDTSVSPPEFQDSGRCCDSVVEYSPLIDMFIVVEQFWSSLSNKKITPSCVDPPSGSANPPCPRYGVFQGVSKYRIAFITPSSLAAPTPQFGWTDLTSQLIGLSGNTQGVDFPDLSIGTNDLYLSYDTPGDGLWRVTRIPLTDLLPSSPTVHFDTANPNDPTLWLGHLAQDGGGDVYFASLTDSSTLRVYYWPEVYSSPISQDIPLNQTVCNGLLSSLDPVGADWLTKLSGGGNAVLGAATQLFYNPATSVYEPTLWFAWSAASTYADTSSCGFSQSHVDLVELHGAGTPPGCNGCPTLFNFSLVQQAQIWNDAGAFAYPSLAADQNEVALSLGFGGGGTAYPDHYVGFWGDNEVFASGTSTTNGNAVCPGACGGGTRWGDYVTTRRTQSYQLADAFSSVGFSVDPNEDTHYVVFGRPLIP